MSGEADRTSEGRLFQSRGPAVANDRSPTVTHRYQNTEDFESFNTLPDVTISLLCSFLHSLYLYDVIACLFSNCSGSEFIRTAARTPLFSYSCRHLGA